MAFKKQYIVVGILLVLVFAFGVWWAFSRPTQNSSNKTSGGFFGFGSAVSTVKTDSSTTNTPQQLGNPRTQQVFKIADGPIAGAAFVQTYAPTTTRARYTKAEDGHVLDMPFDASAGTVAQPVSNTTIPGIIASYWATTGSSTVMQYIDEGVRKTVYMSFAPTTATSSVLTPERIQFLPNNIVSLALSPTNNGIAYLLPTTGGVEGYVANADGTSPRKLFSLPLSQVLLSWPAQSTLLVQTKNAAGVPGIALTVDVKTGTQSPLLYTSGLNALANIAFSKVVYQTITNPNGVHLTYSHDVKNGQDIQLPLSPFPEKCTWSSVSPFVLYCAVPLDSVKGNYVDLWHQGLIKAPDSIVMYDVFEGSTSLITVPGSGNDTPKSTIEKLVVSSNGQYLMFITRGDQSLWGVRLY